MTRHPAMPAGPSFEAAIARYRRDLVRLATRIVGAQEADDVVQVAFSRAWRAWHQLRPDSSVLAWLRRIVANTALSHRRHSARRLAPGQLEDHRDDLRCLADPAPTPEQAVLAAEQQAEQAGRLALIAACPEPYRSAVVARAAGLSYEQIASQCGCAVGTVKSRVSRGKALLARWYAT